MSDVYVGIRAGSDIAFVGGLINHVLTHERWFNEYVLAYTNASTIIEEGFQDTEDLDGLFSGYDAEGRHYSAAKGHWGYEGSPSDSATAGSGTEDSHGMHGPSPEDGHAHKCTLCYDRQRGGMTPACAKACPTASIQFGPLSELREKAHERVEQLHQRGQTEAYLYGAESLGDYGPLHSFFLLEDHPNTYNLPEAPPQPFRDIGKRYAWTLLTGLALTAISALAFRRGARHAS